MPREALPLLRALIIRLCLPLYVPVFFRASLSLDPRARKQRFKSIMRASYPKSRPAVMALRGNYKINRDYLLTSSPSARPVAFPPCSSFLICRRRLSCLRARTTFCYPLEIVLRYWLCFDNYIGTSISFKFCTVIKVLKLLLKKFDRLIYFGYVDW